MSWFALYCIAHSDPSVNLIEVRMCTRDNGEAAREKLNEENYCQEEIGHDCMFVSPFSFLLYFKQLKSIDLLFLVVVIVRIIRNFQNKFTRDTKLSKLFRYTLRMVIKSDNCFVLIQRMPD